MEGDQLRLALAFAFAGRSSALGTRLRPYPDAEAAFAAREEWLGLENTAVRECLDYYCKQPPDWLPLLSKKNWQIIALGDDAYPPLLAQLPDAPGTLFVRGNADALMQPQLAMVGSRAASAEGLANAEHLAATLTKYGFVITSGLAVGIDAASHKGAMQEGTTLAVMGTGPDRIYPARHKSLANEILAKGGALVTEFPPGEQTKPFYFPMRNRIISGLSLGVIVVEAATKSGSLVTARLAMNQGREVFALPGSPRNPLSRGCNRLLRDGANWLETVDDVIQVLGSMSVMVESAENGEAASLEQENLPGLMQCFMSGTNTLDQLQRRSGLLLTDLMNELTDLELEGLVIKSTGGYQKK